MKKLILIAIVALSASAPAMADKWLLIDAAYDLSNVQFLNISSLRGNGAIRTAWLARISTSEKNIWDRSFIKIKVDCDAVSFQALSYYELKDMKALATNNNASEVVYPPPGSLGEQWVTTACSPIDKSKLIEAIDAQFLREDALAFVKSLEDN